MAEKKETLFRKQTLDHISSPEQLTGYLRVTNPGVWAVLAAILLLLGGLFAWAAAGRLETTAPVRVYVEDHTARIIAADAAPVEAGMPLRILDQEVVVAAVEADEYGRTVGAAEISLPDGVYEGVVVTETIRPLDFLLRGR